MKAESSTGCPDIDAQLAGLPEALTGIAPYEQRDGYKCWKVPGRRRNWLQWNDGGTRLPIRLENSRGEVRTWKLFARFGKQPGAPWDRPWKYERLHEWMLGGDDVWGCSCEALSAYLGRLPELEERLRSDLDLSYRYSIERYG